MIHTQITLNRFLQLLHKARTYTHLLMLGCIALVVSGSAAQLFASTHHSSVTLGSPITASPMLRDLDGDGDLEILISTLLGEVMILDHTGQALQGWPQTTSIFQRTSPNVGDIDGDGMLDVVVGDNDGKLHAWELDGTPKDGFPMQLEGTIKSVVRLIDLNGDSAAEMILHTGDSRLYILEGNGQSLSGWPVDLGGEADNFGSWVIASTPTIVDFGYNGTPEILVGTTADNVQAFKLDGSPVEGWPKATGDWVYPSISAVDLNGDYELEVVAGSGDGKVLCMELQRQHDAWIPS